MTRNAWLRRSGCSAVAVAVVVLPLAATPVRAAVATAARAAVATAEMAPAPVAGTLVAANPVNNTPMLGNGDAKAFVEIGTTVYVGGSFTKARNKKTKKFSTRRYLLAYNRTTGTIRKTFAPALNGAVHALAVSPDGKLLVGGAFTRVNGVARKNLVELDPTTGATVTAWVGRGDGGVVRRAIVHGNHLYLAGAFHYINGRRHALLARLNATTGVVDPTFAIDAGVARTGKELVWGLAIAPDGRTLVAVGNFTRVGGLARNQVAMIDLSGTPTVADWSTKRFAAPCHRKTFPFYARDVDFADDGSYFVIGADGGSKAGAFCDTVSRWETAARGSGLDATWVNETGNDSVTAVEAADNIVYVAGHFRWLNNAHGRDAAGPGAVDRYGYAALNPINGMPLAWNPTRGGAPKGRTAWGPIVWELWRGRTGVYAGFDNDGMGKEHHARMGLFPLAGGRTIPALNAPQASSGFLYLGAGNRKLTKVPLRGGTLGAPTSTAQPNLTAAGATFTLDRRLYWSKSVSASTSVLQASVFAGGTVGAPWLSSGFNAWFKPAALRGAMYLNGRLYYTRGGQNRLFYRYFEPDGGVLGCTEFVLPTKKVTWSTVRGLAYVGGNLLFGSSDGTLRSVPFSDAGIDGAAAVTLATPTAAVSWSRSTLFFASS